MIDGFKRNSTIYVGDSIVRKSDTRLSKGEDDSGRSSLFTGSKNRACDRKRSRSWEEEMEKYRNLLKKTTQARVGQIILSVILPVFGNRIQGYKNSKRMAVNGMVEQLCKEEEEGYVDLFDFFVGKEGIYVRDGLHLTPS